MNTSLDQPKRNIGLDLLRVVAVSLVLVRHLPHSPADFPWAAKFVLGRIQSLGWIGMDLFFVLSGFLVAGLIFQEYRKTGRFQIGRFLLKRGFKIYPPFYTMLLLTTGYFYFQNKAIPWSQVLVEALFVQNYLAGFWKLTWSLAVEEHFYILLSVAFAMYLKLRPKSVRVFSFIPFIWIGFAFVCLSIRYFCADPTQNWMEFFTPTHKRIDSLFFGVLISYWHEFVPDFREKCRLYRGKIFLAGIILFLPEFMIPLESLSMKTIGLSLSYLGSGLLLCSVRTVEFPWNFWTRLVQYLASRSYSIYIWHMVVYRLLPNYLRQVKFYNFSYLEIISLELILTLLVGVAMANLIEIPALRLRSKLFQSASENKSLVRPIEKLTV